MDNKTKKVIKELVFTYVNEALKEFDNKSSKLISTKDAAKRLGKSEVTLWRWAKAGYLHQVNVAGRGVYLLSEIEELEGIIHKKEEASASSLAQR